MSIPLEELQLAARNHGLPLEALRHPITPLGLHYLLIHFDIPLVDAEAWRLELGGRVERPLTLSLDDLKSRPQRTRPVTLQRHGASTPMKRALIRRHHSATSSARREPNWSR